MDMNKVVTDFKKLAESSRRLNEVSDQLNSFVKVIENSINALNIGVETEYLVDKTQDVSLGYGRVEKKWVFYCRKGGDVWPFTSAPRYLRIKTVDFIVPLIDKLKSKGDELAKKILEKALEAKDMVRGLPNAKQ